MTFREWILSDYTKNPIVDNRWGELHITVLVLSIAIAVTISLCKNKSYKIRRTITLVLAGAILFFELARRVINLYKGCDLWWTILPRPWCAVSCWLVIAAVLVNRKFFYNLASMSSIICAIIFFAYPSAGFNNQYMQFENVYSIATHSLLLISSVSFITLGFTDFKYKRNEPSSSCIKEVLGLTAIFAYAFLQIFLLKLESNPNPFYFMPNGEVQAFLGVTYPVYLLIYISFLLLYFNLFYLVQLIIDRTTKKSHIK